MTETVLKDEQGNTRILAAKLDESWEGIREGDSVGFIGFTVTPDEENEGDYGYVIDVADDPDHTDEGRIDPISWGNQDYDVKYWAPEERKADLRPINGPDIDFAFFKVGAFIGEGREESDFISSDHERTSVPVYSSFKFLTDVKGDKEKAIDFVLWKYSFLSLTPIGDRSNISYKAGGGRGKCIPGFFNKWTIELYDAAFASENICASTIGHEVEHARGSWPTGAPESKAYNWEYRNAFQTGIDRTDIDQGWADQMGNTSYPDTGYSPYVDDD